MIDAVRGDADFAIAEPAGRVVVRSGRLRVGLILGALVAGSAVLRFALAQTVPGPGIFPDELVYAHLARSFSASGDFLLRGEAFKVWTYGPLYPLLIAPAFRLSPEAAYTTVKAINCLVMSLAALPAYLLARRLVNRERALLAAFAALVLPSLAYSSRVMTESLAYPLFLLAVLAFVRCLESPTRARQLLFVGASALAFLARAEAALLVPAFATATVALALMESPATRQRARAVAARLRAYWLVWAAFLLAGLVGLSATAIAGRGQTSLLGGHQAMLDRVNPLHGAQWLLLELAEIGLALGIVPLGAFLFLAATVRRAPSPAARAFLLTTLAFGAWLMLAMACIPQAGDQRVQERYLFYLEPLVLIAFLGWIDSPTHGFSKRKAAAAALVAVPPLAIPFAGLLNYHVFASEPGLVLWLAVVGLVGTAVGAALLAAVTLGAGVAFVRAKHPQSLVVPVMAYLALSAVVVSIGFSGVSARSLDAGGNSGDRSWIDGAVGADADVVALWSGSGQPWMRFRRIWENEFFNRSVGSVYYLRSPLAYGRLLPDTRVERDGNALVLPDGEPLRAEYVLSDGPQIAGAVVAAKPQARLTLYRVGGMVRLVTTPGRGLASPG